MYVTKLRVWTLAVIAVVCVSSTAVRAEEATPKAEFEKALRVAKRMLQNERPKSGMRILKKALETHARKDYVYARKADIEDVIRQLAFGTENKLPKPEDVVAGKLLKYTPKTGKIHIQYDKQAALKDFEKEGPLMLFPGHFKGPFYFKVQGARYPGRAEDSPMIIIGQVEHPETGKLQIWQYLCGIPEYRKGGSVYWLPAQLIHHDGEEKHVVWDDEQCPASIGRWYTISVEVDERSHDLSVNSTHVGSGRKPAGVYGLCGFEARSWQSVEIKGTVEPAWIQAKIDAIVQKELAEFEKTFDRAKYLPGWLLKAPTPPKTPAPSSGPTFESTGYPKDVTQVQARKLDRVRMMIEMGQYEKALVEIEKPRRESYPSSACFYLSARARMELNQMNQALADLNRCLRKAPEFVEGKLVKGTLLCKLGDVQEAATMLNSVLDARKSDPRTYEVAALSMLIAGRPAEAKEITQRAAGASVRSAGLDRLNKVLVRIVNGPDWTKSWSEKTANYQVCTDIDRNTAKKAAKVLEEAYAMFNKDLKKIERDRTRKFKVYLFKGQAGFLAYQEDLAGLSGKPSENAAGMYNTLLKQLLIWNLPEREEMMRTVRHEGFHQYLDRYMPNAAVWFNEGLAEYYENAKKVRGTWTGGHVHHAYLRMLKKKPPRPLEEFLYISPRKFYEEGLDNYAQSWAFVHMLRKGDAAHRALFERFMDAFQEHSSFDAMKKVLADVDLKELDQELASYLQDLRDD